MKKRVIEEAASTLRRSDTWAAFLMLALAVAPWLRPAVPWQWKLQLVLTEQGAWFGGVCLAAAAVCAARRVRSLSSYLLATAFAAAAFLFFRPWIQYAGDQALWREVLARVFGPVAPPPLAAEAPPPRVLEATRPDGSRLPILFYPAAGPGPAPFVVVAHTGGWNAGEPSEFAWFHRRLARRGWAVAVPAYRLAPDHPWPAQREDVLLAAAYARAHAKELALDPSRWALLGRSAGGQIAEAAAAAISGEPSLKGLAAFYAPADLVFAYQYGREDDIVRSPALLRQLTGGTPEERPAAYRDASPYLSDARFPPTLLLHGPRDPLTWVVQSRRFAGKLAESHTPMVLIEPRWATHGFDYFPSGPGGRAAMEAAERFLAAVFKTGDPS